MLNEFLNTLHMNEADIPNPPKVMYVLSLTSRTAFIVQEKLKPDNDPYSEKRGYHKAFATARAAKYAAQELIHAEEEEEVFVYTIKTSQIRKRRFTNIADEFSEAHIRGVIAERDVYGKPQRYSTSELTGRIMPL